MYYYLDGCQCISSRWKGSEGRRGPHESEREANGNVTRHVASRRASSSSTATTRTTLILTLQSFKISCTPLLLCVNVMCEWSQRDTFRGWQVPQAGARITSEAYAALSLRQDPLQQILHYFTVSLPVNLEPPTSHYDIRSTTIITFSMLLHELPTDILIAFLCRYDLKDVLRLEQVNEISLRSNPGYAIANAPRRPVVRSRTSYRPGRSGWPISVALTKRMRRVCTSTSM